MKKYLLAFGVFFIIFVLGIVILGRFFYPDNIAETSTDGGKKGLKTRIYQTDIETVKNTAKAVVPKLTSYGSNWKIVEESVEGIKVEVPVLVFTDDLEIKMEAIGLNGGIQVDVISKSRVGTSDFGENARSVRKLLNALDGELTKQ